MIRMPHTMPAIFFGHGNPMNALQTNAYTEGWRRLGESIPRPKAVLAISAHWYVPKTAVTVSARPRTLHDFGGFPDELFKVQYPAPGDPGLARRVGQLLAPLPVDLDDAWGLDHGIWSVLTHVYPKADIPVVQLSIDASQPASFHYDLGARLAALRSEGVLIMGSGNVVHNLQTYAWRNSKAEPFEWASSFEKKVRRCLQLHDHPALINYEKLGTEASPAVPTPDHYLPLLYVIAAQAEGEPVRFLVDGFDGGSISMLAVQVG